MTTLVLDVGDTHTNSRWGLSLPEHMLVEGNKMKFNDTQKWLLLDCWEPLLDDYFELAQKLKATKVMVVGGDIVEGDSKNRESKLVSQLEYEAEDHVWALLDPVVDKVDAVICVGGTPAHVGNSKNMEEVIVNKWDNAIPAPGRNTKLHRNFYGLIDGVLFDIKHHTTIGRLPWTAGNVLARRSWEIKIGYEKRNEKPPDLILRHHVHKQLSCTDKEIAPIPIFTNGCFQGQTDWMVDMFDDEPHIGGRIIICEDGQWEMITKRYRPKPRTPLSLVTTSGKRTLDRILKRK